jgi:hypothetical protein
MKDALAWAALLLLALILIVTGFTGSFGKVLAVTFVPVTLEIYEG